MSSASQWSSEEEELATTDAALQTHNHAGELSSCSSKNIKEDGRKANVFAIKTETFGRSNKIGLNARKKNNKENVDWVTSKVMEIIWLCLTTW